MTTTDPYAPFLIRTLAKRGLRLTPRGADLYYRARIFKKRIDPILDNATLVLTIGGFYGLLLLAAAR